MFKLVFTYFVVAAILTSLMGCKVVSKVLGTSEPNEPVAISGVASKGIISGGTVQIFAVNADGSKGELLGSDQTDNNGKYSVSLSGHNGAVIVEVTGGNYTDEASGNIVANNKLRAIIPQAKNRKVAVTPLTEAAVQIAGGSYTLTRINNANAKVAVMMGGIDVTEVQPKDVRDDLSNASQSEKDYSIILAAVSQLVEDGNATNVADAIDKIKNDLEDDGQLDNVGENLKNAVDNFIASPENNSGLANDDIAVDENIEAVTKKFVLIKKTLDYDLMDNETDEIYYYTYNASGKMTFEESDGCYDDDEFSDGVKDLRIRYSYNPDGTKAMEEYDGNYDGTYTTKKVFFYDENGNNNLEAMDFGNDDIFDYQNVYTYDVNNNLVKKDQDTGADGIIDQSIIYTYDDNNQKIKEATDKMADGTLDLWSTNTYNADGTISTTTHESIAGTIISILYYSYNLEGKRERIDVDQSGDGDIDMIQRYFYDGSGNLSRYEYDTNNDGNPNELIFYGYDNNGNKVVEDTDMDGDGIIDFHFEYTWQEI